MNAVCYLLISITYLAGVIVVPLLSAFLIYGYVMRIIHRPTTVNAELTALAKRLGQNWKAWRNRHRNPGQKAKVELSASAKFARSTCIVFGIFSMIPVLALIEALVFKIDVADNLDLAKTMVLIELTIALLALSAGVSLKRTD